MEQNEQAMPNQEATTPEAEQTQSTEQVEVKTFTQDEVNSIAAKEAKKAQEKFLKSLGFEDFKNAKDGLNQYKEWLDSQKSEAEKQAEQYQKLQTDYEAKNQEYQLLQAENEAIKAGVVDDKNLKAVITLAQTLVNDETSIKDAVAKVIEDYPQFKQQQEQEEKKPTFTTGQHQKKNASVTDQWLEAFKTKR